MRKTVMGALFLSLVIIPTASAFAQTETQSPSAVLTAFVNAAKAKNFDLAMTFIASNARITNNTGPSFGEGVAVYTTPGEIRSGFVETVPSDLQILSVQDSGNTGTLVVRSIEVLQGGPGGGPPPGLTHLDFVLVATVVNGQMQTATLDLTAETKAALKAAMSQAGGPPGGPGMPRTGNASPDMLLGLSLLAAALIATGALLRYRKA